jgi:hypothetical protein
MELLPGNNLNLRSVRILVQHRGVLRRLCTVGFTSGDASVYVIPHAPHGHYWFGVHSFASDESSTSVNTTGQLFSNFTDLPHLSLHESGHAQVRVGRTRTIAGPLSVPPLADWRGQHVLTVTATHFTSLPVYDRKLKSIGPIRDFVFLAEDPSLESGRLAFYINGCEPAFGDNCPVSFSLARQTLATPLHVGVRPWSQHALGDRSDGGVIVIGGWTPSATRLEQSAAFLYLRGT